MATAKKAAPPPETTKAIEKVAPSGPGSNIAALVLGVTATMKPISEALGGERLSPFDLPAIKVPSGSSTFWLVPSAENPDGVPAKEVVGVIVWTSIGRARWEIPFEDSSGGGPPDCSSSDGITGFGNPGGDCATCPFAQWNSDPKGRGGQACSAFRSIIMLMPGSNLPVRLSVPASSLSPVRKYLLALGTLPWNVLSSFSLKTASSKVGSIPFPKIVPRSLGPLSGELAANAAEWNASLASAKIRSSDIDRQEVSE